MDLIVSKIEYLASKYDSLHDKTRFINGDSSEVQAEVQALQEACLEATSLNSVNLLSDLLKHVFASIDPGLNSQNVDKFTLSFKSTNEKEQVNFMYFLIQILLQVCIDRSALLKHAVQNIDFSNLLHQLSTNSSLPSELELNILLLIFKTEPFLINNDDMTHIFPKILVFSPDSQNHQLTKKKDELMLLLLNLFSTNQNLLKFLQLFCSSSSLSKDLVLSEEFNILYGKAIFEVHINQALSIWKLFSENFHLLMSQTHRTLFHIFVAHIKITDSKLIDLHKSTLFSLIRDSVSKVKDVGDDEKFLEIYYSLACFKSMLCTFTHQPIVEYSFEDNELPALYDLSYILPETLSEQWIKLNNRFSELENEAQLYFIRIIILNFKILKFQYAFTSDVWSQSLKGVVDKIISNRHLIRYDLLYCIASQIGDDDMALLIERLLDIVVEDFSTGNDVCQEILKFISCHKQWENSIYQTIFITTFLNLLPRCTKSSKRKLDDVEEESLDHLGSVVSKLCCNARRWIAFGSSTPDMNNRKHDKLLGLLRSSSTLLLTDSVKLFQQDKYNFRLILKLLDVLYKSVPLEYISPINQLRCLLALWAILRSSHQAKLSQRASLMEMFVRLTLRLWDSVRCVWLFDLVPSHHYVYSVLSSLCQFKLDSNCYSLFDKFIDNLYILADCERSHQLISQLIETLTTNPNDIKLENVLMLQTIILRRNAEFIKKFQNSVKFQAHKEKFQIINQDISSLIYSNIKTYLDNVENLAELNSMFIIEGLTKLFEYKIFYNLSSSDELNLKNKWKKLLTKFLKLSLSNLEEKCINPSLVQFLKVVVENRQNLSNSLPDNFIIDLSRKLLNRDTTSKAMDWCQVYSNVSAYKELPQSLDLHYGSEQTKSLISFFHSIKTLLMSIVEGATKSEFGYLLEQTLSGLGQWNAAHLIYIVQILLCITENKLDLDKSTVLEKYFVLIFTFLTQTVFAFNKNSDYKFEEMITMTKSAALRICHFVVGHLSSHDLLNNSHVYLIYNLMIESNQLCYTSKPSLFGEQCLILIEILSLIRTKRPYLALNSMCSQLNVLTMLLSSVFRASDETNLLNVATKDKLVVENCSKSLAQLLTQFSRMDDFQPYVGHLIAYYLNQSLNVSPIEAVRKHLTSALFALINSLKESKRIERLHSMLSPSSRELFKVQLERYDKYHRFKGYV